MRHARKAGLILLRLKDLAGLQESKVERVVAFLNKPAVVSEKNLAEQVSCFQRPPFPSSPFPADWAASTLPCPLHVMNVSRGACHPLSLFCHPSIRSLVPAVQRFADLVDA